MFYFVMVCVQTQKGYVHQGKYLTGNIIAWTQFRVYSYKGLLMIIDFIIEDLCEIYRDLMQ